MRALVSLCAALAVVTIAGPALAQPSDDPTARAWVLSGGGLVALGASDGAESGIAPLALAGGFLRLGYERDPRRLDPPPQSFVAFASLTPELAASRFHGTDVDPIPSLTAGVRADLMFEQKEMGLLRVSAAGGVWIAARIGAAAGGVAGRTQPVIAGDIGTHIALGDSGLRVAFEGGAMRIGEGDTALIAATVGLSLGVYLE